MTPVSYKDPFWSNLAQRAEQEVGLPANLLQNILLKGERSNADQISSAGAKTPFQVIPETRQALLRKYNVDAYAGPEQAAKAAALLLKESLERNKGDITQAVGEYIGGTNRKNWGPVTNAYIQRVTTEGKPMVTAQQFEKIYSAHQSGQMSPQEAQEFEADMNAGVFGNMAQNRAQPTQTAQPMQLPAGVVKAYREGRMTAQERSELEADIQAGLVAMPSQQPMDVPTPENLAATSAPVAPQEETGFLDTLAGAGETALALGTGATTGMLGMLGGAAVGAGQMLADGTFGTQEGVRTIQNAALGGMQGGTYQPRTQAGQQMTGAVGDVLAESLPPVLPIVGPAGAMTQGVAPAMAQTAQRLQRAPAVGRTAEQATSVVPPPVQTAMTGEQLAQTAKSATSGLRKGRAEQVLTQQAAPNPEVLQAAERLGIREYLQPDHVSTSQAFRELSQAAKSVPGSELRAQEMQGLEQIGKRADDLINEIGGSKDLSTVNFRVRDDLQKTVDTLSEKSEVLYKRVAEKIPADQQFEATATLNYLNQRANDLGGAENLSSAEKSLLRELSPKQIKDGAGNVTGEKLPTYTLLDSRRKEIGEAGRGKGKFKDNASFLNDNLYRVLSEDQNRVAEQFGVGRVYDAAKKTVQTRKGVENDMVALFGKQIDQSLVTPLSSSIQGLSKGDEARFAKIITAIPPNLRKEVVASGLSTAFGRATKNGELNFNTYANWYEGLNKNKQAYNALMSNLDPSARQSLKDLYTISDGVRKATREFINTGRIMAVNDELKAADTVIGKVFDVAKRAAIAVPLEAGATAMGAPGAGIASGLTAALMKGKSEPLKAVDKLLATPEFQKAVIDLSTKPNAPITKRSVKALVRTPAFRRYAEQVNLTGGPAAYERFMLSAMTQQSEEQ